MTPTSDFTLLIVDDDPLVLGMLKVVFGGTGYRLLAAGTGLEALALAEAQRIDAALLDLQLPDMTGIDLLVRMRARHPDAMICILTGQGGVQEAVEAMRRGAVDFIEKPVEATSLQKRVSQLYELWTVKRRDAADEQPGDHFGYPGLVGESAPMSELRSLAQRVARADVTALITGETGVGKELVARAIHAHSTRSAGPFVAIDCASLAETVTESELFGHAKGAFTGAHEASTGLFRAADGGTLFLDEVGSSTQAKLLRVLQEREVRPVGGVRAHAVDIRVLAATNRDLATEVLVGRFREDLYYRLNVVVVPVPPLRARKSDIPMITRHFLGQVEETGSRAVAVSDEALEALQRYDWPGNVRELQNAVMRAAALAEGDEIGLADLPDTTRGAAAAEQAPGGTISSYEKRAIMDALEKTGGNRRQAARILGIGEATLYRKIRQMGIRG